VTSKVQFTNHKGRAVIFFNRVRASGGLCAAFLSRARRAAQVRTNAYNRKTRGRTLSGRHRV